MLRGISLDRNAGAAVPEAFRGFLSPFRILSGKYKNTMIQKLFSVEPEGSVKGYPWFRGDIRDSPDPKEQNRS